jgi:hypothetical protein
VRELPEAKRRRGRQRPISHDELTGLEGDLDKLGTPPDNILRRLIADFRRTLRRQGQLQHALEKIISYPGEPTDANSLGSVQEIAIAASRGRGK